MTTLIEPQVAGETRAGKTRPERVELFGIAIDKLDMRQAIDRIRGVVREQPRVCRYVVTPNVDHIVMLQTSDTFRRAYHEADLVLADGWPVVWAAGRLGRPLPGLVPGSDLVPALFREASAAFLRGDDQVLRVYLLGAAPGVAARAAQRIEAAWPGVEVVGQYSPPMGFEHDPAETVRILKRIDDTRPDVLVVGLGAPKQELWVHRHRQQIRAGVALCVGATIDFLAGERRRAPVWMRRARLEWLHRMVSEPRRLLRRYARGAWVFPGLVWREWQTRHRDA